ncbi:hypothetical protein [Steroidobacter agaridevorans]|uniref:hypothetical protein n=1 Tax=Steroidobacter agaridevorans TaxID=2695856 RepID=UPI00132ACECC|nr:hypothetical protein [Steroidobacter agaridevorans]GFE89281.1 hypothetical protein GCM10011488_42350 [Steroidobacter agaridevorans]
MDRQYIDDHHIVARYLADQLPDPEREAFETYYLEHPEMLREIETTARFKSGLAQLRASGELDALLKPTPWYARWRYLAIAAAAILVIGVAFFIRTPTPPLMAANLAALGGPSTVASSHAVLRRRGSSFDAEITLPETGEAIELRVLPEFAGADSHFRISLARVDADDNKQPVAEIDHLTAGEDGMVTLYLDAPRVAPGDYEVTITDDTDQTSRFLIRVWPASRRTG